MPLRRLAKRHQSHNIFSHKTEAIVKRMSAFLRGYVKESILGPLFKLFEASLELAVPLIIAAIIDNGINGAAAPDRSYVIKMSLLLLLLGAVGLAFSITAQYFAAKASVGYVTRLRSALFSHLGSLSYSDLDRLGTSTMITRMTSDANQIQTGLNLGLRLLLRSPFVVFGAMVMAFTIDTKSALSFVVAIVLLSIVVFGIMLISIPLYKKVQSRLDGVTGKTRENLSGARVIRAFCKENDEIAEFGHRNRELTSVQMYVGRISSLMNPLTYVIINVAILWLIYTGAVEVHAGNLTQGQVVALYNYMSQILVELIKLANLIITITKAVASGARINSVFDIKASLTDGERTDGIEGEFAVEFSDVSLRYGQSNEDSLSKISFKAKRGDTIGIIGGTGSGKTSLINLIPRFYDPTAGVVLINGQDAKLYTEKALREAVAVVPQKAVLFKGSIRENMKLGNSDATDGEIFEALKIAQAEDVVNDKGGLDAEVEQGGKNFSGGQRQRLTIARALVKKPSILILDDSASALDFATDARLRMALKNMNTDSTVFIVSQRASSIMHADKIIVLDDGEAVGIGTHSELLLSCAVYKEIYASQFSEEVPAI